MALREMVKLRVLASLLFVSAVAAAASVWYHPSVALGSDRDEAAQAGDSSEEGAAGAELWTNNCGRCHNKISPDAFSDRNWGTVMQHMRARANLTGEEARKIVEFLRSAND